MMLLIQTTGAELVDGTLERRLSGMMLDAEYQEIRVVFPDGTSDSKSRRPATLSRTARNALQSFLHGGGANARRRDEIQRQGGALIEVHLRQ